MHSKVNHSMGNTEKDFYTVMAQNMERRQGCRLCDPTISPEDRALLREKGAKLWKREEHKRSHPHVNELDLESERTRFTQVSMEHANDQLLEELSSMMLARIESGDNNTRNETINFGSAAKDGCDLTVATDHGSCRNVLLTRERDFPSLARCQPDLIFNSKMQGISRTEGGATDYQAVTQTRFQHLLKARVIFGRGPRRKLALDRMNLKTSDIPLKDLIGTRLGHGLTTLSLSGNFFNSVPISLVNCLPSLKFLNLSKCNLQTESLPSVWNLPSLTRLDLSHNHLTDFPDNVCICVLDATFQLLIDCALIISYVFTFNRIFLQVSHPCKS